MAEFYCLAIAAEPDLGLPVGTFSEAYSAGRKEAAQIVLELSPLAQYLQHRLKLPWEGTAAQLLELMQADRNLDWSQRQALPKNARWLADQISKIEKELYEVGIIVTKLRTGDKRILRIEPHIDWAIRYDQSPQIPNITEQIVNSEELNKWTTDNRRQTRSQTTLSPRFNGSRWARASR